MEVVAIGFRTPDVRHVTRVGSTSSFTGAGCREDSRDDTRQSIGQVVDILVVAQRQTRVVWAILKTIMIPQLKYIDKVVDVHVVQVVQVPQVQVVEKTIVIADRWNSTLFRASRPVRD